MSTKLFERSSWSIVGVKEFSDKKMQYDDTIFKANGYSVKLFTMIGGTVMYGSIRLFAGNHDDCLIPYSNNDECKYFFCNDDAQAFINSRVRKITIGEKALDEAVLAENGVEPRDCMFVNIETTRPYRDAQEQNVLQFVVSSDYNNILKRPCGVHSPWLMYMNIL